jgi:hypothetical protein
MKTSLLFIIPIVIAALPAMAQNYTPNQKRNQAISILIDQYSQAREKKDTILLKSILTTHVDQLVSSGEWRNGMRESIDGMMRSSDSNPGSRKLIVEKIRFINSKSAIVDARYEIQNTDGTIRKMWSTFIVVKSKNSWKITAIRNMLPTGQS